MPIETFEKLAKAYADENVDNAIEYAKNNPHDMLDTAHHAALLLMANFVKGVTGMSWEDMENEIQANLGLS